MNNKNNYAKIWSANIDDIYNLLALSKDESMYIDLKEHCVCFKHKFGSSFIYNEGFQSVILPICFKINIKYIFDIVDIFDADIYNNISLYINEDQTNYTILMKYEEDNNLNYIDIYQDKIISTNNIHKNLSIYRSTMKEFILNNDANLDKLCIDRDSLNSLVKNYSNYKALNYNEEFIEIFNDTFSHFINLQ